MAAPTGRSPAEQRPRPWTVPPLGRKRWPSTNESPLREPEVVVAPAGDGGHGDDYDGAPDL